MKLWKVALLAFVVMAVQDLLATTMVIAEAHYQPFTAGAFDGMQYLAGLVCTILAVGGVLKDGWRNRRSITIICAITAANFTGTCLGVFIGAAVTHHH